MYLLASHWANDKSVIGVGTLFEFLFCSFGKIFGKDVFVNHLINK
uniref:Uncharacterized protein n=1 Tax=Yersinia enterocolitica W22703 TaxID=913028 RepID=F4MWD4_YEREN|nr:unknown protein [Yersinia enterocolitica W22703]